MYIVRCIDLHSIYKFYFRVSGFGYCPNISFMVLPDTPQPKLPSNSRIAVIGSGLAGLTVMHFLNQGSHEAHLFESSEAIGLDQHCIPYPTKDTSSIKPSTDKTNIDTPLRAVSSHYYNNLLSMYKHLGIELRDVDYSFSLYEEDDETALWEYSNFFSAPLGLKSLSTAAGWQITWDLTRYLTLTPALLRRGRLKHISLETDMRSRGFSYVFYEKFLLGALSVVLSCSFDAVRAYPAENIAHYMLSGSTAVFTSWKRAKHGMRYVRERLMERVPDSQVHLGQEIMEIFVNEDGKPNSSDNICRRLGIRLGSGSTKSFDAVVLATDGTTAHKLLCRSFPTVYDPFLAFRTFSSNGCIHSADSTVEHATNFDTNVRIRLPKSRTARSTSECTIRCDKILHPPPGTLSCYQTWNPLPFDESSNALNSPPSPGDLFHTVESETSREQQKTLESKFCGSALPSHTVLADIRFTRALVSLHSESVLRDVLPRVQGRHGLWFCGSYAVPGGATLLEQAVTSALDVLEGLHVPIPFEKEGKPPPCSWFVRVLSECLYFRKSLAAVAVMGGSLYFLGKVE